MDAADWALAAYGCGGLLLALLLCSDGRTEEWGRSTWAWVVLGWPYLLLVGAGTRALALARRAEMALLVFVFTRAQRRLARLGCTFSVGP